MCLLFIEGEFLFPPLVVETDQFRGRKFFRVQQACQQGVFFLVADTLGIIEL